VVAESPHRTGFAGEAGSAGVIQSLGLDEGKGYVTVKECIVDKVDLLLAAFTQQFFDLIAAIGEGGRFWGGRACFRCWLN